MGFDSVRMHCEFQYYEVSPWTKIFSLLRIKPKQIQRLLKYTNINDGGPGQTVLFQINYVKT